MSSLVSLSGALLYLRAVSLWGAVRSRLFTVTVDDASGLVARLRRDGRVEYAFRVGHAVRAWLGAAADPVDVAGVGVGAAWQAVEPGLHDIALRELALAQRDAGHG